MKKKKTFYVLAVLGVIMCVCIALVVFGHRAERTQGTDIPKLSTMNALDFIDLLTGGLGMATNPSGSMEDAILAGDTIWFDKRAYINKKPERFDVIMFKYPDNEAYYFVKRIIGMPGETIEVIDGQVYINNEFLEEPFAKEDTGPLNNFEAYEIEENSYFVMGDNRSVSSDSRLWINKTVPVKNIKGKVVFILDR